MTNCDNNNNNTICYEIKMLLDRVSIAVVVVDNDNLTPAEF